MLYYAGLDASTGSIRQTIESNGKPLDHTRWMNRGIAIVLLPSDIYLELRMFPNRFQGVKNGNNYSVVRI